MIEGQKDSQAGKVDKGGKKDSLTQEGRAEEKKKGGGRGYRMR